MPKSITELAELGKAVSGSAYERWLDEPIFNAFRSPDGGANGLLTLSRAHFIDLNFGQHLNAVSRLNSMLVKRHIRSLGKLTAIPAADLLALKGVGERQVLAVCVVMEAFGVEDQDILDWIDALHPHRSRAGAVADAARTGKKRRHE